MREKGRRKRKGSVISLLFLCSSYMSGRLCCCYECAVEMRTKTLRSGHFTILHPFLVLIVDRIHTHTALMSREEVSQPIALSMLRSRLVWLPLVLVPFYMSLLSDS